MSHFYANIKGTKGEAHRCGAKTSGIWGDIRGWHNGIFVQAEYDKKRDENIFKVYQTGGSSGNTFLDGKLLIFTLKGQKIYYEDKDVKLLKTIEEE